jgi:hypothetical protein
MSEVQKSPEAGNADEADALAPFKQSNKDAITYFEERLRLARLRLAQAKKDYHEQSMRERARRERDVGKIVLRLIDEGELDTSVVALIREEIREACRSPAQVAAFRGTPLGE